AVAALRVVLALVVAAADVHPERHPGMAGDDRVVHLDALVQQLIGIAAAPPVTLAQIAVEQGSVLWCIDLYIRAAEAAELLDLAAGEVDDVVQVGLARRIRAGGLLLVVVGRRLLSRDKGDLRRAGRARSHAGTVPDANVHPPP